MSEPVSVFDVAKYIYEKFRTSPSKLTAMKLHKLLYYCQAWSLVWDEEPIFHEEIQAWANGPVIKELYDKQREREMTYVERVFHGQSSKLNEVQKDTVDHVLEAYGNKTAQWLSDLTHLENPWKDARIGLIAGERGCSVISLKSLHEYYSSLDEAERIVEIDLKHL